MELSLQNETLERYYDVRYKKNSCSLADRCIVFQERFSIAEIKIIHVCLYFGSSKEEK
jgi:hypothetical protein